MTISQQDDLRPALDRQDFLTRLMLVLSAVLVVMVIALLLQVQHLRNDVTRLQEYGSAQDSAVPASLDDSPEVCRLLGAIAHANGIVPPKLFADKTNLSTCQENAAAGARP